MDDPFREKFSTDQPIVMTAIRRAILSVLADGSVKTSTEIYDALPPGMARDRWHAVGHLEKLRYAGKVAGVSGYADRGYMLHGGSNPTP